ncbi:hypothetical protein ACHAXR_004421 [Thalassiosira sp. AJA248-18]
MLSASHTRIFKTLRVVVFVAALLLQQQLITMPCVVHSLSIVPTIPKNARTRRDFLVQGSAAITSYHVNPLLPAFAADENNNIASLLEAKTISWDGPSFAMARYGTSTLQSSNNSRSNSPTPAKMPAIYPSWFEGYHAIKYKFVGASFPQGRRVLSLRTAGAGLGTCLSLPNVGYSPPSAHAIHFINNLDAGGSDERSGTYEDLAYNIPRKFEAFWPEAKVLAVQTNGGMKGDESNIRMLSPKCLVTGEGCASDINPNLHSPSSRVAIEFDGPTRRGGRLTQSSDVTLLDCSTRYNHENGKYYTTKNYSQYNIDQELQTFYKEIASFQRLDNSDGGIVGKIRVVAFLPRYIKEMDTNSNSGGAADNAYEESEAVAIYDYKLFMNSIDETEAASL